LKEGISSPASPLPKKSNLQNTDVLRRRVVSKIILVKIKISNVGYRIRRKIAKKLTCLYADYETVTECLLFLTKYEIDL
jgi:hypothetical protein